MMTLQTAPPGATVPGPTARGPDRAELAADLRRRSRAVAATVVVTFVTGTPI